jgi:cytochrome c553
MVRAAIAAAVSLMIAPAHLSAQVDYDKDVRPILAASCFGCHGPRQQQSGLRLDLR